MPDFSATLQREKFVIKDHLSPDDDQAALVALSNRLTLNLVTFSGGINEDFIIRGHNMHSTIRMGAAMSRYFYDYGPLASNVSKHEWQEMYDNINKGFEKKWNPNNWITVYHKGEILYEGQNLTDEEQELKNSGKEDKIENRRHAFLDIIEQFDGKNPTNYENSIEAAKQAFKQAGKEVDIVYIADIALVMNCSPQKGRVGAIIRRPDRKMTFNFTAAKTENNDIDVAELLSAAAGFLDGFQLAFIAGMTNAKKSLGLLEQYSDEEKRGGDALYKMGRLRQTIDVYDAAAKVSYRPERPDFSVILDEAEEFSVKLLRRSNPDISKDGEENGEDGAEEQN
jgi:hypothetical protein